MSPIKIPIHLIAPSRYFYIVSFIKSLLEIFKNITFSKDRQYLSVYFYCLT